MSEEKDKNKQIRREIAEKQLMAKKELIENKEVIKK